MGAEFVDNSRMLMCDRAAFNGSICSLQDFHITEKVHLSIAERFMLEMVQ